MDGIARLHALEQLEQSRRILLYPAASGAAYFLDFLRQQRPDLLERVVALGDRDPNKIGLLQEGLPVVAPEAIVELAPDAVVVCSPEHYAVMAQDLRQRLGHLPDVPILPGDNIAEYVHWETRHSVLAQRPFDDTVLQEFPFSGQPIFFHSYPFGDGRYAQATKGALTYRFLEQIRFPQDLTGKTVLDLGAADGFYSLEAKARGAERVMAKDWFYWKDSDGLERFRWLQRGYGLSVESDIQNVNELNCNCCEPADVVLLLGLYYHLPDPFRCFRSLRELTRERAIITGRTIRAAIPDPFHAQGGNASVMVISDRVAGKWTATTHCLLDLLRLAGFSRAEVVFDFCPEGSAIASTAIHAIV